MRKFLGLIAIALVAASGLTVMEGAAKKKTSSGKGTAKKTATSRKTTAGKSTNKTAAKKGSRTHAKDSSRKGSRRAHARQSGAQTWRSRQLAPSPERYGEIQQALISKGYLQGEPTGQWDRASVDALRRFQKEQNLDPSGKIDSLSLIALGLGPKYDSAAVSPPPPPRPPEDENK